MVSAARTALASAIAAGLAVMSWTAVAPASADPVPPVDPLIPVPAPADPGAAPPPADAPAAPQTLLGQFAQAAQSNPIASMQELLAASPQEAVFGLLPSAPGTPAFDPYAAAQLLKPQNYRMPTEDQISPYALAPNTNPSPFARIDAWKGVHAMVHSNLGRMPGDDLGQPLPGTAPPPGTNIPPGLEQFYTPPAPAGGPAAPAPDGAPAPAPAGAPPVDPLLLPTTPPPPG